MIGHIVKIRKYCGFWLVTGVAPEHRIYLISLDGVGDTITASRCDVIARSKNFKIKINSYVFNDGAKP